MQSLGKHFFVSIAGLLLMLAAASSSPSLGADAIARTAAEPPETQRPAPGPRLAQAAANPVQAETGPALVQAQANGITTIARRRLRGERIKLTLTKRPPKRTARQLTFIRKKFANVNPRIETKGEDDEVAPPSSPPLGDSLATNEAAAAQARIASSDDFVEFRDRQVILGSFSGGGQTNLVGEASMANDRDVILVTGNHFAALSTDNGLSFSYVDPFAAFKPAGDTTTPGSFCSDQVALAEDLGSYSLIFWLLQGCATDDENAVRLVVFRGRSELKASANNTTSVCSYVFRPRDFGLKEGRKLDFPQMATTSRFLYFTMNEVKIKKGTDSTKNAVVWRMELDDLDTASCDADIDRSWVEPTKKTLAPVQHAGSVMYFATHHYEVLSGDMLRIYWIADGSNTLSRVDKNIANFPDVAKKRTCPLTTGGGGDPCERFDARITTGFYSNNVVGWLWTAAQGKGYPFPHVRSASFEATSLTLLTESVIWNENYAWVYPAATVNARGEIGVVLYRMGGSQLPEPRGYTVAASAFPLRPDHTHSLRTSTHGVGENQWGDYTTVRRHGNCSNSFMAPVQVMNGGRADDDVEIRAVFFGREGDGCGDMVVTAAPYEVKSSSPGTPAGLIRALETLEVTPVTQNQGTEDFTEQSRTAVYLSTDTKRSDDDILLKPTHYIGSLAASASTQKTIAATLPLGTPLGAYYVLACADHKEKLSEITESNNCRASLTASLQVIAGTGLVAQQRDVDLTQLTTVQTSASAGQQIKLLATLQGTDVDNSRLEATNVHYTLTPGPESEQTIPLQPVKSSAQTIADAKKPRRVFEAELKLPERIGRGAWYLRACLRHPPGAADQRRHNDCRTGESPIRIQ